MTQLIIGGVTLPQTSKDKYQCYPEPLTTQNDMISGRRVAEVRGNVQKIVYSYDYMGDAIMRPLLTVLRSGLAFTVQYLPDNSDELKTSLFLCESLTNPSYAYSRNGVPFWHNIVFTLREVRPHD